jgi:hypothetical protein
VRRDDYYSALLLKAKGNRAPKMDEAWADYRRTLITGWQLIA